MHTAEHACVAVVHTNNGVFDVEPVPWRELTLPRFQATIRFLIPSLVSFSVVFGCLVFETIGLGKHIVPYGRQSDQISHEPFRRMRQRVHQSLVNDTVIKMGSLGLQLLLVAMIVTR